MQNQDSQYNRRPWDESEEENPTRPQVDYGIRFTDREEALTKKAITSVTMPGDVLGDVVRPELPQVALFRPRYGYRSRAIGIFDVMNANQLYEQEEEYLSGFSGTSRYSNGNGSWW